MALDFDCPHCKQPLSAPEDWQGRVVNCPACSNSLVIPSSSGALCPSCHGTLQKAPRKKTTCPLCGRPIFVRNGKLVSLEETLQLDRQNAVGLRPNKESSLLDAMPCMRAEEASQLSAKQQLLVFWVPRLNREDWIAQAKSILKWGVMGMNSEDSLARFLLFTGQYTEQESKKLAQCLYAHHVLRAMSARDREEKQASKGFFPYWKYQTMGDAQVHDCHAALDGLVLPADDPFWNDFYPPWEIGCRCQVIAIDKDEYKEIRKSGRIAGMKGFRATNAIKPEGWVMSPKLLAKLHRGIVDDGSGQEVKLSPSTQSLAEFFQLALGPL